MIDSNTDLDLFDLHLDSLTKDVIHLLEHVAQTIKIEFLLHSF